MWCVECVFYLVYKPLRAVLSRYAVCGNHFLRAVDGLIALGARFGRFFGKDRVLCDGGCAQVARRIGLELHQATFKKYQPQYFDCFGSHKYQHHKSNNEIRALVKSMQPHSAQVFNMDRYFLLPAPIGCALRVSR